MIIKEYMRNYFNRHFMDGYKGYFRLYGYDDYINRLYNVLGDNDKQAIKLIRDLKRLEKHDPLVSMNKDKIIDFILETHERNELWLRNELNKQYKKRNLF